MMNKDTEAIDEQAGSVDPTAEFKEEGVAEQVKAPAETPVEEATGGPLAEPGDYVEEKTKLEERY